MKKNKVIFKRPISDKVKAECILEANEISDQLSAFNRAGKSFMTDIDAMLTFTFQMNQLAKKLGFNSIDEMNDFIITFGAEWLF